MVRAVLARIYSDFLMPPRFGEYRDLLRRAMAQGYTITSVWGFWQAARAGRATKYLVLRHDIDTDCRTAAELFRIERELGVRSSYYFRLSTLDVGLMQRLHAAGCEASYHFEEFSQLAKEKRLRSRASLLAHLAEAQDRFRWNVTRVRAITGLPIVTVASHGDFVNRALGVFNWELLTPKLRAELGIELEAYDEALVSLLASRFSDAGYPRRWKPASPLAAIDHGASAVQILVHPRHWNSNVGVNLADDARRLLQGLAFGGRPTRYGGGDTG